MNKFIGTVVGVSLVFNASVPLAFAGKDKAVCENCTAARVPKVQDQGHSLEELTKAIKCSEPVQSRGQCVADFACNLTRSAVTVGTLGANHMISNMLQAAEESNKKSRSCTDFRRNDCVAEVAATFLKDLYWNGEGIVIMGKFLAWDAPKGVAKGAVKGLKWAGNKVLDWYDNPALEMQKLEDMTAKGVHFVKTLSWGKVASYYDKMADFVKTMATAIYDAVDKFIQDNFGCEQWAGMPHKSKCVKPWEGLACADCNTRINRVCGIGSLIVSEGALLGAAWTKGGKLIIGGAKAVKAGAEASGLLAIGGQAYDKVAKVLGIPREALAKAAKSVSKATGIKDVALTGDEAKAAKAAKKAEKEAKKAAKAAKKGPTVVKTEATGAEAAKEAPAPAKAPAAEEGKAAAVAEDVVVDYKKIDTAYVDQKLRDELSKKYRRQGRMQERDYIEEITKAFEEDQAFQDLCKADKNKCKDIVFHLLNRMEKEVGGKSMVVKGKIEDNVKAEIEKILGSCGWAPKI